MWAEMRAHEHPVNRLHELSANVFTSGDDQGVIKIWDTRQHRCLAEFNEHTVRTASAKERQSIFWHSYGCAALV